MKMVSAAKLRRAQDAITQMRPYAQKLQEMLSNIVSGSDGNVAMDLCCRKTGWKSTGVLLLPAIVGSAAAITATSSNWPNR